MSENTMSLTGRVAVVLGGTSGLGRAISLGLADAGADVIASGRRTDKIDALATEIESRQRRTLRIASDVCNRESLQSLLRKVLEDFPQVDILVNAAGKIKRALTLDFPEEDWHDILNINLHGAMRACQVFGGHMLARNSGRIINITSLNSFVSLSQVTAYAVSKAGLSALTRSLAVEWSKHGVLVNAIAPGVFRTEFNAGLLDGTARGQELLMRTPMARFGRAQEVAGAAVFLASDSASFITGQTIVVDGGFLASGVNQ